MSDAGNNEVGALKAEVARLKASQNAPQPLQPVQGGGGSGLIGLVIAILVLGAAAFAGYYFASPFLALEALRSAAKSGNRDRLDQLVDFPVLRANLKSDLTATIKANPPHDPSEQDSTSAATIEQMTNAFADGFIDAYVRPETVSAIIRNGRAPLSPSDLGAAAPAASTLKADMAYVDLNHFRVKLSRTDSIRYTSLILERRNLFAWRLVRITFAADHTALSSAGAYSDALAAVSAASAMTAAADAAASSEGLTTQNASPTAQTAPTEVAQPSQAAQALVPTGPPPPVRRSVRHGPPRGTDAWVCAHGDHTEGDVIEACDRAHITASRGED
jgi:hypothetical protein